MKPDSRFENRVLDHLWTFHARKVSDVAEELGVVVPGRGIDTTRSFFADLLRAMLDSGAPKVTVTELELRGYSPKTVRMPRDGRPFEAMSFPAFRLEELAREKWESAPLRKDLERLLVAAFYAPNNTVGYGRYEVGHDLFWTPSTDQWATIKKEWEDVVRRVRRGELDNLPKEAGTSVIHLRPHAQVAADVDVAKLAGKLVAKTKQCFWLNRDFVAAIVRENE